MSDNVAYTTETPNGVEESLDIKDFVRMRFPVQAVRVTVENMENVARWCGGVIEISDVHTSDYIRVKVSRPMNDRQTKAFPGDWVLKNGKSWKVYPARAFYETFEEAPSDQ